jgi:hypothetical protein
VQRYLQDVDFQGQWRFPDALPYGLARKSIQVSARQYLLPDFAFNLARQFLYPVLSEKNIKLNVAPAPLMKTRQDKIVASVKQAWAKMAREAAAQDRACLTGSIPAPHFCEQYCTACLGAAHVRFWDDRKVCVLGRAKMFNLNSWHEKLDQARTEYNAGRVRDLLDELAAQYRKVCDEERLIFLRGR